MAERPASKWPLSLVHLHPTFKAMTTPAIIEPLPRAPAASLRPPGPRPLRAPRPDNAPGARRSATLFASLPARRNRSAVDVAAASLLLFAWILLWTVFVAGVLEPSDPLLGQQAQAHPSVAPVVQGTL